MQQSTRAMRKISNRGVCHRPTTSGASGASIVALAALMGFGSTASAALLLDEPPRIDPQRLDDPSQPTLGLLRRYLHAEVERPSAARSYLSGPWGRWGQSPWLTLAWGPSPEAEPDNDDGAVAAEDAVRNSPTGPMRLGGSLMPTLQLTTAGPPTWLRRLNPEFFGLAFLSTGPSFASNGFDTLWEPKPKPIPWSKQCRRRPVTIARYGAEQATFELVRCDGSVAPFALDKLSILARPPMAPSPGELLPDEPEPGAWEHGEWTPSVRLIHARLLWALQKVADTFPRRVIYLYSGYRPRYANKPTATGTHHSFHANGRAADIHVMGIANADLFRICRTLSDVGCGYYPNSKFVHIDVRTPGNGRAYWVDASEPGEPSRYVDSWPGVVEKGALAWDRGAAQ
jgi:hypothetical protein